jgi:hypothetical protein
MAETFESFRTGMVNVAQSSKTIETSLEKSGISVGKIVASLVTHDLAKTMMRFAVAQSTTLTTMKAGFAALENSNAAIMKGRQVAEKDLNSNLREMTALKGTASKQYLASLKEESLHIQRQMNVMDAMLNAKRAMTSFGIADIAVAQAAISGVTELYHTHKLINTSLIEANSDLTTRIGLTQSVLRVQQQLGSEIGVTRDAARELVHYGYDLQSNFSENLKLMVQLHDGLGMSVTQAGELFAVFDRQLKMPVREVADAITRVVNDTGLAADQAGRLAVNIGRAVAALRPGMHSDLAAVTEMLGRYEGALHELGGQVGQFSDLLARMTTPEGMTQAGMLGIRDPRFLESKDATKQVIDSFASYAKRVLGDSRGWDRALRLQVVAEQFGTTGQQVNLMIEAVDRANNQRNSSITLEQRYREQVRASGESFERIGRSLKTLLQQAAVPLLEVLSPLVGALSTFIETMVQSKVAIYTVTGVLLVTLPFVVAKVWSAVAAFTALSIALMNSARAAAVRATTESAQMMLPGIGGVGGGPGKAVASALPKIVKSLGLIASAFTVGVTLGQLLNVWNERRSRVDPKFIAELRRSYDDTLKMTLQRYAATGDTEGVKNALLHARNVYAKRGYNAADVEAKLARASDKLVEAIGTAKFRKEIAESSIERDPATAKIVKDLNQGQAEMIAIADEQRQAAVTAVELQKQQNQAEKEKQEEDRRNRRLNMNFQYGPGSFLNQAYGY